MGGYFRERQSNLTNILPRIPQAAELCRRGNSGACFIERTHKNVVARQSVFVIVVKHKVHALDVDRTPVRPCVIDTFRNIVKRVAGFNFNGLSSLLSPALIHFNISFKHDTTSLICK